MISHIDAILMDADDRKVLDHTLILKKSCELLNNFINDVNDLV